MRSPKIMKFSDFYRTLQIYSLETKVRDEYRVRKTLCALCEELMHLIALADALLINDEFWRKEVAKHDIEIDL